MLDGALKVLMPPPKLSPILQWSSPHDIRRFKTHIQLPLRGYRLCMNLTVTKEAVSCEFICI